MNRVKIFTIIVIMLMFGMGASLTKSLRLGLSADGMNWKTGDMTVAVGVPFYVLVRKGLSVNPLEYVKNSAVKIERAAVDDPQLFKVETWNNSAVLVRGLASGETKLRVTGRVGLQKEDASISIRTAEPTGASLQPMCSGKTGNSAEGPVLVGVGQVLPLEERLLSGATVLMSNRYPEVDFGAFTPVEPIGGKLKTSGKDGELVGPVQMEATAPETPGPAAIKIPEYGFTLPIQVFEASAINGIIINELPATSTEGGKATVRIQFLINNHVPCKSPMVPVEITVGPSYYCSLENKDSFRRIAQTVTNYITFEGVIAPQLLVINTVHAGKPCEVTARIKGIGKAAHAKFEIKAKPSPSKNSPSHHRGGGRHFSFD